MAKNIHGTRSDLIHCDNCGEDYSSTYKRCPFCGARPSNTQPPGRSSGGSRAAQDYSRSRQADREDDYVFDGQSVFDELDRERGRGSSPFRGGGGRHLSSGGLAGLDISPTTLIGFVVSGVIVLAAILIVILVVIPMIRGGQVEPVTNSPNTALPSGTTSQSPLPTSSLPTSPGPSLTPGSSDDPTLSPAPSGPASPAPSNSVPPATGGLSFVALGRTVDDITISDRWPAPVQLEVRGASGTVTWKSSDPTVATVSATGLVTAVNKGECYITATDSAGKSQNCRIIRQGSNTTKC